MIHVLKENERGDPSPPSSSDRRRSADDNNNVKPVQSSKFLPPKSLDELDRLHTIGKR